ncbi:MULTISPECIES: hypothetical protein [Nonomuraea]|uniref:ABM domain-containing protein n=1 Tax=Nonomuraea mangrovi TaxID=2316207 RepID=A0ABW4STN2_9ACTN
MAVVRTTRFQVDPANVEELLTRRATLISAVRAGYQGLTETRLARLEDGTFVDAWRWDSAENMRTALAAAPTLPEAGPAFALTVDATADNAEIVDER